METTDGYFSKQRKDREDRPVKTGPSFFHAG